MHWSRQIPFYLWYVVRWTVVITAGGALVGAIFFPVVGALAGISGSATSHLIAGAKNLGFLTFVWAPGIAIVMAFDHAYKRRRKRSGTEV